MKLGIVLRTTGPTPRLDLDFVLEAERLGFDSWFMHIGDKGCRSLPRLHLFSKTTDARGPRVAISQLRPVFQLARPRFELDIRPPQVSGPSAY
jgi:hypothetical protein